MSSPPFYAQEQFWRQAPGCNIAESDPPAPLRPFIAKLGITTAECDLVKHRIPDGCYVINIAVGPGDIAPRSYIYPPFPAWKWMQLRAGTTIVEARFRWGRGRHFFGIPPQEIGSCGLLASEVLGPTWHLVVQKVAQETDHAKQQDLFVQSLVSMMPSTEVLRPEVVAALNLLEEFDPDRKVADLILASCLSGSQLRRVLAQDIGMPPSQLLRLSRLWQAMQLAATRTNETWSIIAAQCGYFDSAHLIDEFRFFAETSPTQWLNNLRGVEQIPA